MLTRLQKRRREETDDDDAESSERCLRLKTTVPEAVSYVATSSTELFRYEALDRALKQIRVLDVEPGPTEAPVRATIRHVSLLETPKPQYDAISYVWGDRHLLAEITLDGCKVDVPRSSEEALRNLRSESTVTTLWIDAVCINPNDVKERNHQVALMKSVYRNANCTHVWLGDSDDLTSVAFSHIELLLQEMRSATKDFSTLSDLVHSRSANFVRANPPVPLANEAKIVVRNIFNRPWFHRVWVIQEASLSIQCICQCGKHVRPMVDILRVATWIHHEYEYGYDVVAEIRLAILNANSIWSLVDHEHGLAAKHWQNDFTYALSTCSPGFLASDSRDHIFSLLGLATFSTDDSYIPPLLTPDYDKSTDDVFRDATIFMIDESRSLWPFQEISHPKVDDGMPFCRVGIEPWIWIKIHILLQLACSMPEGSWRQTSIFSAQRPPQAYSSYKAFWSVTYKLSAAF